MEFLPDYSEYSKRVYSIQPAISEVKPPLKFLGNVLVSSQLHDIQNIDHQSFFWLKGNYIPEIDIAHGQKPKITAPKPPFTPEVYHIASECNPYRCYYTSGYYWNNNNEWVIKGYTEYQSTSCRGTTYYNGESYSLQEEEYDASMCGAGSPPDGNPNTPGGGPTGGGPSEFPNPNFNINSLPSCSQNIVRQILNSSVVGDYIIGALKSWSQANNIQITFLWEDLQDSAVDADTRMNSQTNNSWVITLNSGALANASRDYIAATIIHEAMHVILGSGQNTSDHNQMANNYIQTMANSLLYAGFIMNQNELTALSWGGLSDTTAWATMIANDQANNTGVTGSIAYINSQYKNGLQGQICN
ncbi:hypothetical protein G8759_25730 [Spirosoma aureum]|uniref:Uncharacterized protein n=1 Tax=Spirosoma aureum TaxID=2692134 RepID=A0A6G9ATH2_9BACT|nr:hypothetical protein [Spirosoma aureum]QIP15787.1 hypothetical protein G8759_25730 [Spirosoma aureum]